MPSPSSGVRPCPVVLPPFTPPANSNTQKTATGTFSLGTNPTTTLVQTFVDGSKLFSGLNTTTSAGQLVGTYKVESLYVVFAPGSSSPSCGAGIETCETCTLDGTTGGFMAIDRFEYTDNTHFTGTFTFVRGTGGLVGLTGGGPYQGDRVTGVNTYTYRYQLR
jgi:hypothetical protein